MITTAVNVGACYEAQKGWLIASERRYGWSRRRLEKYWDVVANEEKVWPHSEFLNTLLHGNLLPLIWLPATVA